MSAQHRSANVFTQMACIVACLALLSGCSGSGSVNLGGGQSPDPATVDFPIFYVKRSIPMNTDDLHQLRDAIPDAELFKRDRASPSAPESNITRSRHRHRPLRHQGRQRLLRRQESGVRDARTA